jgi:hypothetical protein
MQATIPLSEFDLPRFIEAIEEPELAFQCVEDGYAIYDPSTTPMQKLESGQDVFARFSTGEGESFHLADGSRLELPDDFDGEGFFDDSSCYGYVVRLADEQLNFTSAVMRDEREETVVYEVDDAGPFEAAMIRFIDSLRAS